MVTIIVFLIDFILDISQDSQGFGVIAILDSKYEVCVESVIEILEYQSLLVDLGEHHLLGTLIVIVKDIVINVDSVGLGGSVDRNCVCKSSVVFSIVFSKLIESDDLRID